MHNRQRHEHRRRGDETDAMARPDAPGDRELQAISSCHASLLAFGRDPTRATKISSSDGVCSSMIRAPDPGRLALQVFERARGRSPTIRGRSLPTATSPAKPAAPPAARRIAASAGDATP